MHIVFVVVTVLAALAYSYASGKITQIDALLDPARLARLGGDIPLAADTRS